ncbi:MAG: VapE domain-containing protein [Bdellovibrionota bacterium]
MDLNKILTKKIKEFLPEGKEKNGEWHCRNPLRDDMHEGSFSISLSSGLWKDFADNSSGNMVTLVSGIKKITSKELAKEYAIQISSENKFKHFQLGYPSHKFIYRSFNGDLIGYICRFNPPEGGKTVRPYSNNKWSKEGFPNPYPLYNCHKLKDQEKDRKILIVEGEKCADFVEQFLQNTYIVLTWPFGAASVEKADWRVLEEFENISIWPDNDDAGKKAALKIKKILNNKAHIVPVPEGLPKGWDLADIDENWNKESVIELIENKIEAESDQQKPTKVNNLQFESLKDDPRIWLSNWIKRRKVEIHSTQKITIDGEPLEIDGVIAEMNCDFVTHKVEGSNITIPVLKNALDLKITQIIKDKKKNLINSMKYKFDEHDTLKKYVVAVIGEYDDTVYKVLQHFIWQVKRKMFGLKVTDHLMPILYGSTQRQGKSEAVKKLLSPIDGLWINGKFADLADERHAKFFEQNFVMLFDEMRGAKKADVEATKERITAEYISFRVLFTHHFSMILNNCTLIGTSNSPLTLLIRDISGMRRFYEIEVKQRCDWNALNSIDYKAIWNGVDEQQNTPYIESCRDKLEQQQENNRDQCSVEQWISEHELTKGREKNLLNDVYSHYCHFCRNSGLFTDTKRLFGLKLKKFLQIDSLAIHGTRCYFLNRSLAGVLGL